MKNVSLSLKELEGLAYLKERQKGLFCVRIKTALGMLNSEQLLKIAELAKRYGQDMVHLTARQGIEIPHLPQENVYLLKEELEKVGLDISVTGARIRAIVSCPGTRWCPWAWVDTKNLAERMEKEFYGKGEVEIFSLELEKEGEIPGINPQELEMRIKNKISLPHKFRI
ncbi:MAG: hypothetical protein NC821_04425, partial [Candidatus Omnitrophica bacterium]|nr:hypothetical protein [Candidatus Omnitrophota bacterium]